MRQEDTFHFKKFSIRHARSMPVGTDSVLLGAWTNTDHSNSILDIGTGGGLIALMMAQRTEGHARIDAIEPDPEAFAEATENVRHSLWHKKVFLHPIRIQDFSPGQSYDLIVSNPPYFNNSLLPPAPSRIHARHTITLSHNELLDAASRLLSSEGRFSVILPYLQMESFIGNASSAGLGLSKQCLFRTRMSKPFERILLEFSKGGQTTPHLSEIVLYDENNHWSAAYTALTAAFYLKPL